jgi:hypothetical protein
MRPDSLLLGHLERGELTRFSVISLLLCHFQRSELPAFWAIREVEKPASCSE